MKNSRVSKSEVVQEVIYPKPLEEMEVGDFDAFDEELSLALGKIIPSKPAEMPPVADLHAAYLQTLAKFFSIPVEYQSKSYDIERYYIALMKITLHDLNRFKDKHLDGYHEMKGLNFFREREKAIAGFKTFFLETFSKLKNEILVSREKKSKTPVKGIVKSVRKKIKKSL